MPHSSAALLTESSESPETIVTSTPMPFRIETASGDSGLTQSPMANLPTNLPSRDANTPGSPGSPHSANPGVPILSKPSSVSTDTPFPTS